ncbi:50S ribosomal protein L24e [Candidatus Micrarchaeota archaeon]|nr:50S ribosomal protein L24e [Candidatus Micrarchaeota archaeon]
MAACSFCGKEVPAGEGLILFKREGTVMRYCSKKCEKNAALGRNQTKLKWTKKAA